MYEHIVVGAGVILINFTYKDFIITLLYVASFEGINGSSAAYQLARRGRKVLLLDKVRIL